MQKQNIPNLCVIKECLRQGEYMAGYNMNHRLKMTYVNYLQTSFREKRVHIHASFFSIVQEKRCETNSLPIDQSVGFMLDEMERQLLSYTHIVIPKKTHISKETSYFSGKDGGGENDDIIAAWIMVHLARNAFSTYEKYDKYKRVKVI